MQPLPFVCAEGAVASAEYHCIRTTLITNLVAKLGQMQQRRLPHSSLVYLIEQPIHI